MSEYNYCGECRNFQTTLWMPMREITHKCDVNAERLHLEKDSPACPKFERKGADYD